MNGKGDKWRGGWTTEYANNFNSIFNKEKRMKKRVFIFDVDGTLTPSRLPMTDEMDRYFGAWLKHNKFYLVTGSDISKLQEQMCYHDIESEGFFTCCGNEFWIPDPHVVNISAELVYENKWTPPGDLLHFLEHVLERNDYHPKTGNHVEDRGTMVNFSIVGRNCTLEQRHDYSVHDEVSQERNKLAKEIVDRWPELDAAVGGQISVDIYPKGKDKSQVLDVIRQHQITPADEYIFIGDRTMKGGNDYPLAKLMDTETDCKYYQVKNWEETKTILEKYAEE